MRNMFTKIRQSVCDEFEKNVRHFNKATMIVCSGCIWAFSVQAWIENDIQTLTVEKTSLRWVFIALFRLLGAFFLFLNIF